MASRGDSAGSVRPRPRARRSIAHVPRSKLTSGTDKENSTTDIGAIQPLDGHAKPTGKDKKSRSKSLGPGGLDALQNSNGNRRKSTAAIPLKSILKPTVPVSPVRKIPTFEETRRRTPARSAQQDGGNEEKSDQGKEGLLIDFDTPGQPSVSGNDNASNPFDTFNATSAIRDGKAAEKEKKERERKKILQQREARRKSMANRRVSFAPEATLHTWNVVEIPDDSTSSSTSNSTRRASALTNAGNQASTPKPEQSEPPSSPDAGEETDITFSPVKHQDLQQIRNRSASSDYDSAGGSQELFSSPFSGSSAGGSDDTGFQDLPGDEDDGNSSGSDTNFDGESTAMSLDDMTVQSAATANSDGSNSSTSSSARLNEALRQAAQEAGTKGNSYEETGEMSMEIAEQEITGAFQPWIKKGQRQSFDWGDISASNDQENVDPSTMPSEPDYPELPDGDEYENEDLSMEVTNAIGGILPQQSRRQSAVSRKSIGAETNYDDQTMEFTNVIGGIEEQPSPAKSLGADSNANDDEEMTMEFTSVVGGVLSKNSQPQVTDENDFEQHESFTPLSKDRNFSEWDNEEDMDGMDMEMTGAVGGILPPIEERTEIQDDEDQTAGMDVTTAMGRILPSELEANDQDQAKKMMEAETDSGQLGSSPFQEQAWQSPAKSPAKSPSKSPAQPPSKSPSTSKSLSKSPSKSPAKSPSKSPAQPPSKSPASFHFAAVASENGSPSLASVRSRPSRQSLGPRKSTTPTSNPHQSSPAKKITTPPKQVTPQAARPTTPGKTPPSSNVSFRGASPKKLFEPELRESARKYKSPARKSLFGPESANGQSTPLFVLRPHDRRRSSGLGIDKEGLGSPRVAAMLDKRRSIGDEAPQFVPHEQPKQGVRFEDPLKLQEEVDREREEEEDREDGHIPPIDPSERDATSNLKDMISSLTPKKNKFRGRKSLHVGAARGLLGKRPAELDLDDDEAENTPKRLKGREASPVKNIRLPAPSSLNETFRRSTRSPARGRLSSSPAKASTTPTQEPRRSSTSITPLNNKLESLNVSGETEQAEEEEPVAAEDPTPEFPPIQLQEFLNMTNIHFMELTTTKRRHTTAPGSASKRAARLSGDNKPATFEDCVAAGFCTVPMLELYQHSCRELKSYINEGRQVIRSIETETFADNPPLFREYATAAPDIRLLMDNQFRNVKTHARLLSKATWYEWRMKLLEGLKEGLNRHVEEMKGDDNLLSKHEALLNSVVPAMIEKHSTLEQQATSLQQLADEMENCDQDELRGAREKLSTIEDEIAEKKKQLQEMQDDIQEKTNTLEAGAELKAEFTAQIQEAERVKQECRGWSAKEIGELKESVHKIERQTGWSIISAKPSSESSAGPMLTMSYCNQLQLMLHPAAFYVEGATSEKPNLPLDLRYSPTIGNKQIATSTPNLTPIALLVLKSLQNHIATLAQPKVAPNQLLRFISEAWDLVLNLEEETRMLEFCGVTKLKLSEVDDNPSLRARCSLLGTVATSRIPTAKGSKKVTDTGNRRIDVDFAVKTRIVPNPDDSTAIGAMDFDTQVIASKVYGFGSGSETGMSENEMRDILNNGLEGKNSGVQLGNGVWSKAVQTLTGAVF